MSGVYNNSIFIIQLFILQIQACMLVFCTVLLDFDPMAKSEEELKSLLMKVKEENEKVSLKLNIWKTKIMVSGPITSWQIGKNWKWWQTLFLGLQNHCRWWLQPWNYKMLAPWKKSYDKPRQYIKKQRYYFSNKGLSSQSYGFSSSSHIWMWVS